MDLLAIGAGMKKFNPKVKKQEPEEREKVIMALSKKQSVVKDNTFLTSVNQQAKMQMAKKKSLEKETQDEYANPVYDGNLSDIDLNMAYSDDEDKNYFENDKALLNHLHSLEESNLFKIKHLEDIE